MSPARRIILRDIMEMAWSLYRAELNGPDPRTFADALTGSWKWFRARAARMAAAPRWAKVQGPQRVAFGTMLQSPIRRSLTGQPHAYTRAREAGRLTSRVGA